MQTFHVQENYTVQASSYAAARDRILADSASGQKQEDYRLSLSGESEGDWILVITTRSVETDPETGKAVIQHDDSYWHYKSFKEALSDYEDAIQEEDTYSASITKVVQSTDYGR